MPEPKGFENALYSLIAASADLVARVGTRAYPDVAPDSVGGKEYLVYTLVSGERDQTHDSSASLTQQRWQISCVASDAKAAKTLSKLVHQALHGYKGTIAGVRVEYLNTFDGPSDFTAGNKKVTRIVELETMFAEPA